MSLDDSIAGAWSRAAVDDPEPTTSFFESLLRSAPNDPVRQFELANAYDWAGRESEAVALYRSALAAGLPEDRGRRARIQLGSSLRNIGQPLEAIRILAQVMKDHPDNAAATCFHALALADAGRPQDAVSELIQLVTRSIDTDDVATYRRALDVYARGLGGEPEPNAAGEAFAR